jgi:membrane protease YdiL (CAAX protease family)
MVDVYADRGSERPPSPLAPFLAYVVGFQVLWIGWPYYIYPRLTSVGEATLTYALANIGCRLLFWVAPVFLYLRYVDGVDPLRWLKLKTDVRRGLIVAGLLTIANVFGSIARFGVPHLSADRITWNSVIGTSFLVGFIEEIPYRGFMLQKFEERMNFWAANLLTSTLFLLIHVPGWIALHMLRADLAASIFFFGVVMAVAFKYSRSLWAPILTHSANDFLSFVVFRV